MYIVSYEWTDPHWFVCPTSDPYAYKECIIGRTGDGLKFVNFEKNQNLRTIRCLSSTVFIMPCLQDHFKFSYMDGHKCA